MGRVYTNNCKYCGNTYRGLGKLYCSSTCKNRDRANDPEFIKKLSEAQLKRWTPEQRQWRSDFNKKHGIKPPGFQKGHKPRPMFGADNPNWRGGTTLIGQAIRLSGAYKQWRKTVYERDAYKCVWCGIDGNGKNLNADHIKPFWSHPDLRLNIDNGRTLCIDCHKKTGTWGRPPKK